MDCDIAVVGAGPAGSVASLVLSRAGLRVMQFGAANASVDRRGETVASGVGACLFRLGLPVGTHPEAWSRVTGFLSRWGSSRETYKPAFVTPDAPTFCIDRAAFDAGLIDAAAGAGTSVSDDRVISLHAVTGGWLLKLASGRVTKARLVIDASGRGARFARSVRANIRVFDRLVAVSFVLKPDEKDIDRCVVVEAGPDGWLYSALEPSGHRIITFFTDADISSEITPGRAAGIFGSVLAGSEIVARYARNDRVVQRRRWPAATLALDHAYGAGILAVGDAAMTRDPLSSQGIAAVMEDAEAAASVVALNFGGNLGEALRSHEDRSRQKLAGYLRTRCSYYRSEARWTDRPFWARRHELQKPGLIIGSRGTSRLECTP